MHYQRSSTLALLTLQLAACTTTPTEEQREPVPFTTRITTYAHDVRTMLTPASVVPVTLDVVIDASPGSPGADRALLRPSITAIASRIAALPGSVIRYWSLGDDASRTIISAIVTVTAPKAPGRAAVQAHQESEQRRILAAFDSLVLVTPKRSPMLSSVVRVSQETRPSGTRHMILVDSDLLEHSDLGDLECEDPISSVWQARLRQARLFLPGTMRGTTIIAVNSGLRPVANQRCTASVAHHHQVMDFWASTARAAGATFTAITGNLTTDDLTKALNPKEQP